MSNANQDKNRNSNTRRQSYYNIFPGFDSHSNSSLLRSNNLSNSISSIKLQNIDLTFTSQILEYNKVNGSYNPHVSTCR